MGVRDTEEQEIAAIEAGFKQALIGVFIRYFQDTDHQSVWGDGAMTRFKTDLAHARIARAQALKVVTEE